ncbi:MAG: hypothetical protein H0V17_34450, partial [Deltaproteobacteria bacterium]|nr:hypothetical protein [Deltaproteobacteria bacterium]
MEASLRRLAHTTRNGIVAGTLRGRPLVELVESIPYLDRDSWVQEVLEVDPPPPDIDLPAGAVPYLPCGVDEILATVRDVPLGPDDELVDLGSGLGRVVILAHLLTGARARGIEIQAHLVARARATHAALALPASVAFDHACATEAELDGSVIFLYAPFNGAMLARVLDRLAALARRRRFTICAVGLEVDVPWLS